MPRIVDRDKWLNRAVEWFPVEGDEDSQREARFTAPEDAEAYAHQLAARTKEVWLGALGSAPGFDKLEWFYTWWTPATNWGALPGSGQGKLDEEDEPTTFTPHIYVE